MKIAILGAGFTGLTAALKLTKEGHEVSVFEKEKEAGGLAGGFQEPNWQWTLEKTYHHLFTNDKEALNLASKIGQNMIVKRPKTDVFIDGKLVPFDSPLSVITFPYLSFTNRLRTGLTAFYLKLSKHKAFEGKTALPWIRKFMGKKTVDLIWEPLFLGKFGKHKEEISLTWFWARIKKRTSSLAYPEGGFQAFADKLASEIKNLGGKIYLNTEVINIQEDLPNPNVILVIRPSANGREHPESKKKDPGLRQDDKKGITKEYFDKVIVTLPTPIFTKITPELPKNYVDKISSISHLHSLNLILVLDKPFLEKEYWLNITDTKFPFLVLAEHTNFMDKKYYNNQHILYIGNYLPDNHPYLKMTPQELFKEFKPYLSIINPNFKFEILNLKLFTAPNAQPIVTPDYLKFIPEFQTPLKNIFLANLDMVYPWDRGTNYAIEMGEKVAELIIELT